MNNLLNFLIRLNVYWDLELRTSQKKLTMEIGN